MDKAVLKSFAIESRKDLMEKVERKIKLFYIDEEFKKDSRGDVIVLSNDKHTLTLTKEEDSNRDKLLRRIVELGYDQVIEEAAYTWFNRIIAIRYMEVNDMLPLSKNNQSLGINVLSSKENTTVPEVLKFSILTNNDMDISFSKEKYYELKDDNEKFKYVLLLICKKLGKVIPQVFGGVTDYIDILVPDNLLSENGFVNKLINNIDINDFKEVEIIGWLYQFYISEKHDEVIDPLRKKGMTKEEIAAATQLFTPDWIVRYMVENSLGKYALEHGTPLEVKNKWKYYIDNELEKKEIIDPQNISFIDPCCGSGHILVYAFEVFMDIYKSFGYNSKDIPKLILENNIYGLEIDDRAGQLSILSVLLKAREYDKDLFNKEIVKDLNIVSLQETNSIRIQDFPNDIITQSDVSYLIKTFRDAKEIGSLLNVEKNDYSMTLEKLGNNIFDYMLRENLIPLIKQAKILEKKYDIVVTNPPYLSKLPNKLKEYISKHYKTCTGDIFGAFIIKNIDLCDEKGYCAYLTPNVWLSIKSYEELRRYVLERKNIDSLIFFAHGSFNSIACVDVCSFVLSNSHTNGVYIKLSDFKGGLEVQEEKVVEAINNNNCDYVYEANSKKFNTVPGCPITVFSASDNMIDIYKKAKLLGEIAAPKQGLATADNNRFLRLWYEVDNNNIFFKCHSNEEAKYSNKKWFPYNKGGNFRKWYGNNDYVVNWENDGYEIKNFKDNDGKLKSRPQNLDYYFRESISWSLISSYTISFRYKEPGFIFDIAGMSCFSKKEYNIPIKYLLGLNNSCLIAKFMLMIAPTINYQAGNIATIPVIYNKEYENRILELVDENIDMTKFDWDLYETSWDFKKNNLLMYRNNYIKDCYLKLKEETSKRFKKLYENEKELNDIYLNIYNLKNDIKNLVNDRDISLTSIFDSREEVPESLKESYYIKTQKEIITDLISYAVGCMFGRYSLDTEGLIYAGGEYDKSNYKSFIPDDDNIIPISDNGNIYYDDDIVGKFKNFIKIAFGNDSLNNNIDFIAETLGKRGTESSEDTIRRYFVNDFYNDHIKMYQKRPIYWLFDSGRKNGFKCLIYLHRYNEQIVSKIRTKYLHNTLSIYQRTLEEIDYKLVNEELNLIDKRDLQNRKSDLNNKITECNEYEEMVGNVANKMIKLDLDDGVINNYAKFVDDNGKSILAKIK